MKLLVNGKLLETDSVLTVAALLERLAVRGNRLAVAVNGELSPRAGYATHVLRDGDRVDVIHPVAGG